MYCAAARATYDAHGKNDGPAVVLVLGEIRLVGAFHEDAWTNLTADEADELAEDLRKAATLLRNNLKE